MKKVISFCLYGTNATYILGMTENILLAKQYFPDWIVRIYYNSTVPEKYVDEFKKLNAECILKENLGKNKMNWEGMFWRWMPLDDKDVAIWISRDADSRLSEREAKIVKEWEESGKTLHSIRDHRCHMHCIMGGMFGINNILFHSRYKFDTVEKIIKNNISIYNERPYNVDQEFLNKHLWDLLKNDVMAHISNQGRRVYDSDIEIPRVADFIGKQYRIDNVLLTETTLGCDNKMLKNKIFKIKSEYNDYCLDVYDNKVVLKHISNSDSQLWTLDENSHIIHVITKEYLSWDSKNDLILSTSKHVWTFSSSGFITNNNKAIDIKGGLLDRRQEVWMYKLNYSTAQQWQCVTKEYYKEASDTSSKKNKQKILLILDHDYHHKNKKGMEMICDYLDYELIYGNRTDIQQADIIYCPKRPFNASQWPTKQFIFGPHHSIFPEERLLRQINNANNSVYIQPSPWARDVWINKGAEKYLPIKSFPFPVEIDLFNSPKSNSDKTNVFIMFKHRHPDEMSYIEGYMRKNQIGFRSFRYGGYKQEDYLNYLQTCKYGIWVGTHESQGFALEEALSCDIPLLVWSVTNMRQQHGWTGCPDVPGTTIAFWDERCGEYFENQEDFEKTYETFMKKIDTYKPREFIENTVSVKQCATNFENLFVKNDDELCNNNKKYDELYLDIGANIGLWSIANIKENRKIVAIEASPTTFKRLTDNIENMGNIECLNFAVTDSLDNTITFYEHPWDTISTLNKEWLTSPNSRFGSNRALKETIVNTITIDKIIEKYGVPDLIKIDVEGAEYEVCKSLTNRGVNIITFEWSSEMYDVSKKSIDYLSTLGFDKFHIQNKDDYTYVPTEFEHDLTSVKNILNKKIPKVDMGMVWCTKRQTSLN